VLESGAVVSAHYRGGTFKGTNFLWEINGTEGDLVLTSGLGHPAVLGLTLSGSRGENGVLEAMPVPQQYYYVPTAPSLLPVAYNVGQHYAMLAKDLREHTHRSPTFADAVARHRMVEAIERAAATGTRQSYLVD
jgi:predicted dehydrogenase